MLTPKQEDEFNNLIANGKEDEAYVFYKKVSKENLKKEYGDSESLRGGEHDEATIN